MTASLDFSLVVPFYNEEKNVIPVCEEIIHIFNQNNVNCELIAVDNGSRDKTSELIEQLFQRYPSMIKPVRVEVNQGMGWGIRQGLKHTKGTYVGFSDGDGQVPAKEILKVYLEAKEQNLDFCQGRRIRKDTLLRRLNTLAYNFIFYIFFGCSIHDIGSKPKIFKREWLDKLNLISKDWFIDGETILKFHYLKGKMKEVPVEFYKRKQGKSKINFLSTFQIFWNIIKWRWKFTFHLWQ